MTLIVEPFGPDYPRELGATVAKYRRLAKNSIFDIDKPWRDLWADAIEKSIKAKQRAALQREAPTHRVSCASKSDHSCGLKISAAVREQHRSALLACPGAERRKRTDHEWRVMYEDAMQDKRRLSLAGCALEIAA